MRHHKLLRPAPEIDQWLARMGVTSLKPIRRRQQPATPAAQLLLCESCAVGIARTSAAGGRRRGRR